MVEIKNIIEKNCIRTERSAACLIFQYQNTLNSEIWCKIRAKYLFEKANIKKNTFGGRICFRNNFWHSRVYVCSHGHITIVCISITSL